MITRSHLIFRAAKNIPSRFALVASVSRASRRLHKNGTRMGQTINEILDRIGGGEKVTVPDEPMRDAAVAEVTPKVTTNEWIDQRRRYERQLEEF